MSSESQRFRCALSALSAFPMLLWFALDDQTMFMTIVSALLPIGLKYHRVFTAFDMAHARHPVLQPWIHSLRCGGGGGWDATASKAEGKFHLQVWPGDYFHPSGTAREYFNSRSPGFLSLSFLCSFQNVEHKNKTSCIQTLVHDCQLHHRHWNYIIIHLVQRLVVNCC